MISARLRTMIEEHSKEYCGTLCNMGLGSELNRTLIDCLEALVDRIQYEEDNDLILLSHRLIKIYGDFAEMELKLKNKVEGGQNG